MTEIQVCVGSSCHIKGSYQVIKTFENLIRQNHLDDKLVLKASFCMGRCMSGISVTVDGMPIENVGFANAEEVFYKHIFNYAANKQDS
ncbi:MAG TPA: NADH-quinone oxidoreductase subunit F [Ruminococcaceae bacterium]|nr:NADH-quinone oxidoreductase subunit F [Oscillospiraceae bacterium]